MAAQFEKAIMQLLLEEGGYVYDPDDLGGETNMGISKRQYPRLDIRNLKRVQAMKIYQMDFWEKFRIGEITNQAIANAALDMFVHMNPETAASLIQNAMNILGAGLKIDGVMGTKTISQINNIINPDRLLDKIKIERIQFYLGRVTKDKSQAKFLAGWIGRTLRAV